MIPTATPFYIGIAGLTIGVWCDDTAFNMQLDPVVEQFRIDEIVPDVKVHASTGLLTEVSEDEPVFESGGLWQLTSRRGEPCFRFVSPYFGPTPYKEACFSSDFSSGRIQLHHPYFAASQNVYPLEYPLDELLILNLLSQRRGIEVHACGLIDEEGRGHVFMGHSGAGKTTLARLWAAETQATILSDDRIILRRCDSGYYIYGTPWHGEAHFACTAAAPLASIVFIGHGSHQAIRPLAPAAAISRLISCSFPPFYDPEALAWMLEFGTEMMQAVPAYDLAFLPNAQAVRFLEHNLRRGQSKRQPR